MSWSIREGDCVEVMRELDESSVDAVVTDPPYNLNFMGRGWDRNLNHGMWATEALRVLRPGGHLLAFGGTRTYHRLACALEDAGFEIRDCLAWLYGSGFPKSLDVSKAIDKAAGAEREVVGLSNPSDPRQSGRRPAGVDGFKVRSSEPIELTAPATPDAETWQGWGTALKPAFEPIVLARKPLAERNVAANVLAHGTGALNVDGTRIETDGRPHREARKAQENAWDGSGQWKSSGYGEGETTVGRWPANVILDEEAARLVDESSGETKSPASYVRSAPGGAWHGTEIGHYPPGALAVGHGDRGGASRFFYTAKTSRAERERGVRDYGDREPEPKRRFASGGRTRIDGEWVETHSDPVPMRNDHPTVKPVDLMAWLCRLVTPPGGLVLDPFTGSGSTGIAALREGFNFLGIEREPGYVEIARARIQGDSPLFNVLEEVMPL